MPIHLFIVVLILTADDLLPPVFVIKIPLDRLFDAVLKFCLRQPAEFVVNLSRVDCISEIMTLTIGNICDQALGLASL